MPPSADTGSPQCTFYAFPVVVNRWRVHEDVDVSTSSLITCHVVAMALYIYLHRLAFVYLHHHPKKDLILHTFIRAPFG